MGIEKLAIDDAIERDEAASAARTEQIGVRSVEVAGHLLKALATLEGPQTLSVLSTAAGLQPAKAHRYLVSLIRAGFVEQSAADGRYDFGGAARLIGRVAMNRLDIMRIGSPLLSSLREELRETVFMGVWTPSGPIVLECLDVARPVAVVVRRGALLPLLTSAFGLICAAYLPETLVTPFIEAELAQMKPNEKVKARAGLAPQLAAIRRNGFSLVQGSLVRGLDAVAVPVVDHQTHLVAGLACVGTQGDLDIEASGRVVRALKKSAQQFSGMLG